VKFILRRSYAASAAWLRRQQARLRALLWRLRR
jgi:hypothetical protein